MCVDSHLTNNMLANTHTVTWHVTVTTRASPSKWNAHPPTKGHVDITKHYNSAAWPQQTAGLPIVSRLATCNTSQRQQLVNGMQHAPVSRASQKYTTVLPTRAKLIKIKISNEIKLNEFRLKRSDKAHKKIPAACGCNKNCTHAHTHTYTYMNVHVMSLANFRIFEFLK